MLVVKHPSARRAPPTAGCTQHCEVVRAYGRNKDVLKECHNLGFAASLPENIFASVDILWDPWAFEATPDDGSPGDDVELTPVQHALGNCGICGSKRLREFARDAYGLRRALKGGIITEDQFHVGMADLEYPDGPDADRSTEDINPFDNSDVAFRRYLLQTVVTRKMKEEDFRQHWDALQLALGRCRRAAAGSRLAYTC